MSIIKRAGVKYEYFGSKKQSTLPPNKHFTVTFVAKIRAFEGRFKQCMQGRTNSTLQSLLSSFGGLQKLESSSEGKKSWFGFLWKEQSNPPKQKPPTQSARPAFASPSVSENRSDVKSSRPNPGPNQSRRPKAPGHHGGKRSSTHRAKPTSPFPASRAPAVRTAPLPPPERPAPPQTFEPSQPLEPEPRAPPEAFEPSEPFEPPEPEPEQQPEETEKSVALPSMESKKAKGMFDEDEDAFNDNFSSAAKTEKTPKATTPANKSWFPSVISNLFTSKEKVYKPDFSKKGPEVEMT